MAKRIRKAIVLLLLLSICFSFSWGQEQGKPYFAKMKKPFRIELKSNPTTGYNWYIAEMDKRYFNIRSSGYQAEKTGLVGSGGKSYWEIIPLKRGKKTIRLLYYRPWEGKDKAADQYKLDVIIK